MATNISNIVALTLNIRAGVAGLGSVDIPIIFTDEAVNASGNFGSGYAKLYTMADLASVSTDFSSSGVTKQAADALAAVTPRVNKFYIAKRATAVAGVWTLTADASFVTSNSISGTINGETVGPVAYTTDNAGTLTALASAIQALEMVDTAVSDGTDTITITFEEQWEPAIGTFTVTGGASQPGITSAESTPAVNLSTDIDNAVSEGDTNLWYLVLPTTTNKGAILAAAANIEAQSGRKYLWAVSTDSAIYTAGSSDVASVVKANSYERTNLIYHDDSTEMIHAGLASRCLAITPGGVTANNKTIAGATAAPRTNSEFSIAKGKYAGTYENVANGINVTQGMKTGANRSAMFIRDADYLLLKLEEELLNLITSRNKIPFNSAGRQLIQARGDKVIKLGLDLGILDPDQENTWYVPPVADISSADKSANNYTGCVFNGYYLDSVDKITATVNINLG